MIATVDRLDASILGLVRDRLGGVSKGGMASKLEAARLATTGGENVIIASGGRPTHSGRSSPAGSSARCFRRRAERSPPANDGSD